MCIHFELEGRKGQYHFGITSDPTFMALWDCAKPPIRMCKVNFKVYKSFYGVQLKNPLQPESASQITQKKRKPRHRWYKKKISSKLEGDSVKPEVKLATTVSSQTAIPTINSIENSEKPKRTRKRRMYFKAQTPVQPNIIESRSAPYSEAEKVVETSIQVSVSSIISNSVLMDKKRDDESKSREHILAEREARRSAKHKIQDKSRNLEISSPTKSRPNGAVPHKTQPNVQHTPPVIIAESTTTVSGNSESDKSREQVLAERELKKQAKLANKNKTKEIATPSSTALIDKIANVTISDKASVKPVLSKAEKQEAQPNIEHTPPVIISESTTTVSGNSESKSDKSREQILAERELKKQAKLASKNKTKESVTPSPTALVDKIANVTISDKPVLSKAERREKQEAQRAAKSKLLGEKVQAAAVQPTEKKTDTGKVENASQKPSPPKKLISANIDQHKVKLFNHLYPDQGPDTILNSNLIHPAIVKLGTQYANGNIVGSNARCLAFMERMKMVIKDYETPSQKEFGRGLEAILQPSVHFLQQCRPLSVSITNALKFIKWQISQLPANQSDAEMKEHLLESIDTYVRDQIEKAAQAISITVQEKISNGDVILTFGCSSLISHIIEEAQKRKVDFSVIVVDSLPHYEGQVMLRRLVAHNIPCSCVLINAIGFVMPQVTKVLLGANALMANGYVMSRAGTAEIALMAKFYNVPVLVCCETHKFSERVQTDAFVFNEIGDPQELVPKSKYASNKMENWRTIPQLTPLNLRYDITPPELVSAVITELAILPCTSVPVILRIKPSEIGY